MQPRGRWRIINNSTNTDAGAVGKRQMQNQQIAMLFEELGDLLEIQGANSFRVRAYRNAARTVENLHESIADILQATGRSLTELEGIGKDLAAKIEVIVTTGELP